MQAQNLLTDSPNGGESNDKDEAVAFYAQNNVTEALEALLNTMYGDKPVDIYGYMSEYFHGLSMKPVVTNIKGLYQFDGRGERSLCLTLYCRINGIEKVVCTHSHPILLEGNGLLSQSKGEKAKHDPSTVTAENDTTDNKEVVQVIDALQSIEYIKEKLTDISPVDQITSVDEIIGNIQSDDDREVHKSTSLAISCLMIIASATLTKSSPFFALRDVFSDGNSRLTMPTPLLQVITGGQTGLGKLKIRSVLISPSLACDIEEGSGHVIRVYREIGNQLSTKQGVSGYATLPDGSYLMAADKIEQILELIKESVTQAEYEMNKEILLYIDIGADTTYDHDKKKYELATGQWKTSDEMIALYGNLLSNYAGLVGFIDSLHPEDCDGWSSLTEQLGNKCLLVSNVVTDRVQGDDSPSPFVNCASLSINNGLVSDYFKQAEKLKGFCNYVMLSFDHNQTIDSLNFMMEMAVALKCKFVRLSAPVGIVSMVALSRLSQLQAELKARNLYRPSSALLFTSIKCD